MKTTNDQSASSKKSWFSDPTYWDSIGDFYEQVAESFLWQFSEKALLRTGVPRAAKILDVAAGTGTLAVAASKLGHRVLAVDFSPGMIRRIQAHRAPNVEARVMDGQRLEFADTTFDAVFSIFGVFMFPDWRTGLREMFRVTRLGGTGTVGTWATDGAGPNVLLMQTRAELFPDVPLPPLPSGAEELRDSARLAAAMTDAGYAEVSVESMSVDFLLPRAALNEPNRLFGYSPLWFELNDQQRAQLAAAARRRVEAMPGDEQVAFPSTALFGIGRRPA